MICVDDLTSDADAITEAIIEQTEVIDILADAGFQLMAIECRRCTS